MLLSHSSASFKVSEDQLTIDFVQVPDHSAKIRIADRRIQDLAKKSILYYEEGSVISSNTFDIKIGYKGRSYRLTGVYRKEEVRSFSDRSFTDVLIHLHPFTTIFAFRNGRYDDLVHISEREYEKFSKYVQGLLADSWYNATLAIRN